MGTVMNTPYIPNNNSSSASFNGNVILMNYKIWMAKFDTNADRIDIADTESFKRGVSISSINWGFFNPGAYGHESDVGKLTITLHDIAGGLINDILRLHSMSYWIYFHGPDSTGALWSKEPVIYSPIVDECKIEFSATQGFTYTISGTPMVKFSSSPMVSNKQEFSLNGNEDSITASSHFGTYITKHFVNRWNSFIHNDLNKPTAKIAIEIDDTHALMSNQARVTVKNEKGEDGVIEPFLVPVGATVPEMITKLFETRFKKIDTAKQDNKEGTANNKPTLEINFKKWKGDTVTYYVRFNDNKDTKTVIVNDLKICVGSDLKCSGSNFRGELVGMDFGSIMALMSFQTNVVAKNDASIDNKTTSAQSGNTGVEIIKGELEDKSNGDNVHTNAVDSPMGANVIKTSDGSWGAIDAVLGKHMVPNFSIDISMPYAFAFSPKMQGGYMKDAIEGSNGGGIHVTQGAELEFYWYVDPTCSELVKQPKISNKYRLATVTHSMGLNGNTTQIKLSTLNTK